ncbi:glutathionylspermidine synthase family protein, partial [Sulfurimonas sp.]|uniref:glutathionylspermidine synthase family protein n=1 Tax=Sulfurimonas sp. TaxID=2022749 RepID=UPI00261C32DC
MVTTLQLKPINDATLEEIGFSWHTDSDGTKYVSDAVVEVTQTEADAYYEATNAIYDMYVEAAEYVIANNLFFDLGIPFNLIEMIKKSW